MKRKNGYKGIALAALVIAVFGLSLAYAALTTGLSIQGSGKVTGSTWGIAFQNLQKVSLHGNAAEVTAPTISGTTLGKYSVNLSSAGDYASYTFDIKNTGTQNAKITAIDKKAPTCTGYGDASVATANANKLCPHLEYTLTYSNGGAVGVGDTINGGVTKTVVLKLLVKDTLKDLPTNDVKISNLDITIAFGQV